MCIRDRYKAINVLETITLDKESSHFKAKLAQKYADIVYNGQWEMCIRDRCRTALTASCTMWAMACSTIIRSPGSTAQTVCPMRPSRLFDKDKFLLYKMFFVMIKKL